MIGRLSESRHNKENVRKYRNEGERMATSKEFHDYVLENLQRVGDVSTRKMMGEYLVYYRGKLIGDICDNCFLLKPVPAALELLSDAERAYPYEGSKTLMVVVEEIENTELMEEVLNRMWLELPQPKKRKTNKN